MNTDVPDIDIPTDRDSIVRAIAQVTDRGAEYWSAFDTQAFFAPIGEAWSPADNVRHLIKSIRPVTKALRMPKLVVRILFGGPRHPSRSYDGLREHYLSLVKGADAGKFAPSRRELPQDRNAYRDDLLRQFTAVNDELSAAVAKWPDRALDRHQLPHPLMGRITVREMLFFTIYHQTHHVANVVRRRSSEL